VVFVVSDLVVLGSQQCASEKIHIERAGHAIAGNPQQVRVTVSVKPVANKVMITRTLRGTSAMETCMDVFRT